MKKQFYKNWLRAKVVVLTNISQGQMANHLVWQVGPDAPMQWRELVPGQTLVVNTVHESIAFNQVAHLGKLGVDTYPTREIGYKFTRNGVDTYPTGEIGHRFTRNGIDIYPTGEIGHRFTRNGVDTYPTTEGMDTDLPGMVYTHTLQQRDWIQIYQEWCRHIPYCIDHCKWCRHIPYWWDWK